VYHASPETERPQAAGAAALDRFEERGYESTSVSSMTRLDAMLVDAITSAPAAATPGAGWETVASCLFWPT
jgi:hypothetical protein